MRLDPVPEVRLSVSCPLGDGIATWRTKVALQNSLGSHRGSFRRRSAELVPSLTTTVARAAPGADEDGYFDRPQAIVERWALADVRLPTWIAETYRRRGRRRLWCDSRGCLPELPIHGRTHVTCSSAIHIRDGLPRAARHLSGARSRWPSSSRWPPACKRPACRLASERAPRIRGAAPPARLRRAATRRRGQLRT
jgi:hypothetical protein